jgi:hypothetical protein
MPVTSSGVDTKPPYLPPCLPQQEDPCVHASALGEHIEIRLES